MLWNSSLRMLEATLTNIHPVPAPCKGDALLTGCQISPFGTPSQSVTLLPSSAQGLLPDLAA